MPVKVLFLLLAVLTTNFVYAANRETKSKNYTEKMRSKIAANWFAPTISNKYALTEILFFINERGRIISHDLKEKSGDDDFDAACLKALQAASPLPIPPGAIALNVFERGVMVQCRPGSIRVGSPISEFCAAAQEKVREGYNAYSASKDPYLSDINGIINKKIWFSSLAQQRIVDEARGGAKALEVVVGFDIASSGAIENKELFCPSVITAFNDEILKILKKIKSFPPPPQHLLDKEGHLKILWKYYLYIQ